MTAIASLRVDASQPREVGTQPALSALRSAPWFSGWPAPALAALSVNSSLRSFGAGQVVAPEGKPVGAAVLVVKGRIRAVRRAEGGRELTLETFREGDLAVDALFEGEGNLSNDWVAAETSLLLFIPRDEFLTQARQIPEATLALARDFERRLVRAKGLATGLVLADVETRLYNALCHLAREEGEQSPEGTTIARSPTQQELGNSIGACRETVSRIIAELSRQGMLSLRGRRLTLSPRFFDLASAQPSGNA
jgi:CRP/FNR family cyclic AMP-dependent transcriptional regulator